MYTLTELEPNEEILHQAQRGSSSMYILGIGLTLLPPFVFGIALLIATYMVDKKSGTVVTNRRLVQHRQWPWPGKFSHGEVELKYITKVGKEGIGGFDIEQGFLNKVLGLGDIEIYLDMEGRRDILFLHGVKKPKSCIAAIKAARDNVLNEK